MCYECINEANESATGHYVAVFDNHKHLSVPLRGQAIFWFRVSVTLGLWLFSKCSVIKPNVWASCRARVH